MAIVKVRAQTKYGRKMFYPANEEAELFCQLTKTGKADGAKCLVDWQIDIIKQLGHEVEATVEVVKRNRAKRPA